MIYMSVGQTTEFGAVVGATMFWGELGGANDYGRPGFMDTELSQTKYAIGMIYRQNITAWNALRFNMFYARVDGDDQFLDDDANNPAIFRKIRNLNFKSIILEFSVQYEQNLLRYQIGRRKYRFAPYILGGAGVFYFNPKSKTDNQALRPLATEGQGSSYYPDRVPYSQVQPVILGGFGLKFNFSESWSLGFEYGHRFTFTDYIDDVSKTYPAREAMEEIHGAGSTNLQLALAHSAPPYPNNPFGNTIGPNIQRGDPADYDHYIFAGMITLTYTVSRGKIYCPKF